MQKTGEFLNFAKWPIFTLENFEKKKPKPLPDCFGSWNQPFDRLAILL